MRGFTFFSGHVGRCVQMGDEAHGGNITLCVGRKGGHEVSVFVECYLLQAEALKFAFEKFCEFELSGCRRSEIGGLVALGVEFHIFQKSVD